MIGLELKVLSGREWPTSHPVRFTRGERAHDTHLKWGAVGLRVRLYVSENSSASPAGERATIPPLSSPLSTL